MAALGSKGSLFVYFPPVFIQIVSRDESEGDDDQTDLPLIE